LKKSIFPVLILPAIGHFQETAITLLTDKQGGFGVFLVLIAFLAVKALNDSACGIIVTIRAGIKPFAHAADFHPASGFFNISAAVFIADFASPAPCPSELGAGFTICATAPYLKN
jgi:hypothetical protein